MLDIKNEVLVAEDRIRSYIRETVLDFSLPLRSKIIAGRQQRTPSVNKL